MVRRARSRANRYRFIAYMNTVDPYRIGMYLVTFVWGIIGITNDLFFNASWDYLNINRIEYALLGACMTLAPALFVTSRIISNRFAALIMSASADLSLSLAIFGYSLMIVSSFGVVFGVPILWMVSTSLTVYATADIALIGLIRTQPDIDRAIEAERVTTISDQMTIRRLRTYLGPGKWQSVTEAANALRLLARLDPSLFDPATTSPGAEDAGAH